MRDKINKIKLLLITAYLAIGDGVTTMIGLNSGQAYEQNPSARNLMDKHGFVPTTITLQILFFCYIYLLLTLSEKVKHKVYSGAFHFTAIVLLVVKAFVVLGNIYVLNNIY